MKKKICFVVAIPGTAQSFLLDHIAALSKHYDVYIAGNIKSAEDVSSLDVAGWQHIDIERQISIKSDLKAVRQLTSYFRRMKFDAVHSVTPKAGLIAALAGYFVGIPNRIHIFTGQVWATRQGVSRLLLKSIDKLIANLDTKILVDGKSQRNFLIKEGILKPNKSIVLGEGSICGVNTERFKPDNDTRKKCREQLGIADDKIVFVFLGRLNRDKGVHELLAAFNRLVCEKKEIFLILFGFDEENLASTFKDYTNLTPNQNFFYYGVTPEPHKMLQCGDIFVLPTYREGFGSSVIEAQCLGLPVITSDAYGVLDASIPGETGLQCHVRDVDSLFIAMKTLVDDNHLRQQFGEAGRERVLRSFTAEILVTHWVNFYKGLLGD